MDLSIVIPCYCSGENIGFVLNEIDDVLKSTKLEYEIIMVNDGSPDNTFETIKKLSMSRKNTIAINLSKNSGQHAAIMAGFRNAKGKYIATCEDDGQTQINLLPELIDKLANEDYDVAAPVYKDRGKRSIGRKIGTWCAKVMANWMIPRPKGVLVPIYFVAKRFIIDEVINYNQPYPYIEGLVLRSTYNICLIDSVQKERIGGKSGYNLKKMINLWLNGFTSFSIKPLRISVVIGFISALLGFFTGLFLIINKLINNNVLLGWSSIISIMLFMFGIVLMVLGMIGEYIGRIYLCINNTPQYVIKEVVNPNQVYNKEDKENE